MNLQEENKMELSKMLAMVDHTLLKPEATWAQIQQICDDAMKYHTATVCIPASYVARCKAYMQEMCIRDRPASHSTDFSQHIRQLHQV